MPSPPGCRQRGRIRKLGLARAQGQGWAPGRSHSLCPCAAHPAPQVAGREVPEVWEGAVSQTFQDGVPPSPGVPGKLPGSPRPWDSSTPHTLSCSPHPGGMGEPWGCLLSSPLPLHPAWWAAPSCRVSSRGGKTELWAELGAWPKAGGCCLEPLHTDCLATRQLGPQASQSPPRNNPTPHGVPTWAGLREEIQTPPCLPPGRLRA